MLPEQQQRIMGYFIEEAKDHLNTIEQGLLKLQATIEDPEMANEVFRAAHSVKGGAAMLGLESIQHTAHRMEDYFKILKESPVQADRTLESLFLQVFDILKELVEQLQGPFGLTQDKSEEIMSGVQPLFDQLATHLNQLVQSASSVQPPVAAVSGTNGYAIQNGAVSAASDEALQTTFTAEVSAALRQMLALFKQADTDQSRQRLQDICQQLNQLGERFGLLAWCDLMQTAWLALSFEENSYRMLAPVLIKELKKAQEWVLSGRAAEIAVSEALQALLLEESEQRFSPTEPPVSVTELELAPAAADVVTVPEAAEEIEPEASEPEASLAKLEPEPELEPELEVDEAVDPADFDDLFEETEPEAAVSIAADEGDLGDDWLENSETETDSFNFDLDFGEVPPELSTLDRNDSSGERADESLDALLATMDITGPDVGTAELNSLADLFDGDISDLDTAWQAEASPKAAPQAEPELLDLDVSVDFADLLEDESSEASPPIADSSDELSDLFGDMLSENESAPADSPMAETDGIYQSGNGVAELEESQVSLDGLDLGDDNLTAELAELSMNETELGADSIFDNLDSAGLAVTESMATAATLSATAVEEAPLSADASSVEESFDLDFGTLDLGEALHSQVEVVEAPVEDDCVDTDSVTVELDTAREQSTDLFDLDTDHDTSEIANGFDDFFAETENSGAVGLDRNDIEPNAVAPDHETPPAQVASAAAALIDDLSFELDETDLAAASAEELEADNPDLGFDAADFGNAEAAPILETVAPASSQHWDDASTEAENAAEEDLFGDAAASDGPDLDRIWEENTDAPDLSLDADLEEDADLLLELTPSSTENADETVDGAVDDADFDDLDALLEDSPEPTANVAVGTANAALATDGSDFDFDVLDALLEDDGVDETPSAIASPAPSHANDETDFGDLERLLEDGDTPEPTASAPIARRPAAPPPRRSTGLSDQTMRVVVKDLDNLSNLVGELVVNRNTLEQDQERMRQFLDNLLFQVQQLNDVGQRIRDLYERSLLESSLMASRQAYQLAGTRETSTTSHATGATFDALEMDRFTGFHSLSQEMIELTVRVRESASDISYTVESSDQVTRQFRQATMQLQEGLNKARMVPFSQTADRLPRAVRDISIKCGKEARLVVEGRDTLIDKMLLEQLYDPMTHLVNNAIAHGIESPEVRETAGKPREGSITVRAFYQGNQTVIYVADDGGGIDPELVKGKAVQKGLISQAEANTLSVIDIYELLFHPGFSTRDQVDDYSGRGVGMDVVRTSLSEIRGTITIDSELGKGTSFTIRLPLTLSISKALSCVSNQARIAFPMDGVEDMFDLPRDQIPHNAQGQPCIHWRDSLLPYQSLTDLLKLNRMLGRGRVYGGNQEEDIVSVIVLRSATSFIALQVDQVIGEQEIVIKQLEAPVPKPVGIAGATVLGDGRVMPIADVLELIDIATGRMRRETASMMWAQGDQDAADNVVPVKTEPTVLIVDDSITVRELLSMSFHKVGYRVEQARDGQEAWEKLRSGLPCDLVFCDIEMPRMDGLELLSRMQKDGGLKRTPIAMLTSRGADRHRQMAVDLGASGYFTKPYLEEALLDAAQRMLNGESLVKTGKGVE
ncbi:response regulator [Romeria aff. gracilis LEGE 07310]|uniref:histidine kinase n=1 Tax=Vasconcelosia minhoensis LEGE 07310 TaxID=915328 RepID=A0A8J7ARG4_9CYAN|nr:response regulator [Romeria gracilis]MBE9079254.1 response regulator [Romeria aff. gracilis LEGE 07310]